MKALFFWACMVSSFWLGGQVSIAYDTKIEQFAYAANRLQNTLELKRQSVKVFHFNEPADAPDITVCLKDNIPPWLMPTVEQSDFADIGSAGYQYKRINAGKNLIILSVDEVGGMYGLLDLEEEIKNNNAYKVPANKLFNPSLDYRIIKFNLPWSPYRESDATKVHLQTCRDLQFWERFLDMMVENRFNVLSLWNKHPFPYMIKATNFPKATPFTDAEMEDWKQFWKSLFKMAKERGIQTFIVNWNIVVSPEFAEAYGAQEYNDLSDLVKQYTRESVRQVINEYEDLTGIGVTLADWMGNFDAVEMDPQKREDWIEDTFVAGLKEADRPVKFLHRSVLAGDPMAMRQVIDRAGLQDPVLVEIKFNWSHGHSTPTLAITHDYHSGKLDERFWQPKPDNYNIQWMIRNEDFFILRWGDPDFIRQHLKVNQKDYVSGYFIGSEGYIPAVDYASKPSKDKTWLYAFEKQWLFYKVWGRLLYNANAKDELFESAFDIRYGNNLGKQLLQAYKLASKMPLRLAAFHRSTWDYTLYAEGFLAPEPSSPNGFFDRSSPFLSIDELIYHETLDPTILSIPDYVNQIINKERIAPHIISPMALANLSEKDGRSALFLVQALRSQFREESGSLKSELDDVATWSYLSLYLADKIRAGVALESFRKNGKRVQKKKAIRLLKKCLGHWDHIIGLTKDRYVPTPHVSTQHYGDEFKAFSWELFRNEVVRDIEIAKAGRVTK